MHTKHVVIINTLLLKTMESYINTFVNDSEDAGSISMYAEDVAYAANALVAFNATKDASALHDSIMLQDTLVREYYISVLLYIERNKLIPSNAFCCV